MNKKNRSLSIIIGLLAIVCFLQFCAIIWIGFKGQSFETPDLSYQDFLTAIFTAVTLILSMLAIMLGIMAFVGWQGFQSNVQRITSEHIRDGFDEEGEYREVLKEVVLAIATSGIAPIYDDEEQDENNEGEL